MFITRTSQWMEKKMAEIGDYILMTRVRSGAMTSRSNHPPRQSSTYFHGCCVKVDQRVLQSAKKKQINAVASYREHAIIYRVLTIVASDLFRSMESIQLKLAMAAIPKTAQPHWIIFMRRQEEEVMSKGVPPRPPITALAAGVGVDVGGSRIKVTDDGVAVTSDQGTVDMVFVAAESGARLVKAGESFTDVGMTGSGAPVGVSAFTVVPTTFLSPLPGCPVCDRPAFGQSLAVPFETKNRPIRVSRRAVFPLHSALMKVVSWLRRPMHRSEHGRPFSISSAAVHAVKGML